MAFPEAKPLLLPSFSICAYQHLIWTAEQQLDTD